MMTNGNGVHDSILKKAKENARIRELNKKLLEACKLNNIQRVDALIQKGANLHLLDKTALHSYNDDEKNPVHFVAQYGCLDILKIFVGSGADCNAQDRRNTTPLHYAVFNGYTDMINYLVINCKANIEAKDIDGGTPLSWAAYKNQLPIAEQLLRLGAKIDEPDFDNRTSLYWAAYQGHKEMVEFLVSKGADTSIKTKDGDTPLDIAVNNGSTDVVELLYQLKKNKA